MSDVWKEPMLYTVLGGALILTMLWPMTIRLSLQLDVGRGEGRVSAVAWLGKIVVETMRTEKDGFDVALRIWVLHVMPVQLRLIGEERAPEHYGEGDEAGSAFLLDFLWQRWRPLLVALGRGGTYGLKGLRIGSMRLRGWLGLGDAARTATVYGMAWAVVGMGAGWLQRHASMEGVPAFHVSPVYNRWMFRLEGEGVVQFPFGHLLRTGWVAAVEFWRVVRGSKRRGVAVSSPAENV